jgi:dethiobiotin synthetase
MSNAFIITGTDTDVGKTVFSAALMLGLNRRKSGSGFYWKPVQSGIEGGVDTRTVQKLTQLPAEQFFSERYVLSEHLSPHRAAELDGVEIDIDALDVPECAGTLLIEGAGGLMVPITRTTLGIDIFSIWDLPVILCARTGLGTINHTLLSISALRERDIKLHGIVFIGDDNPDNMRTIAEFSNARVLGRLPWLKSLNADSLSGAFDENFRAEDFEE